MLFFALLAMAGAECFPGGPLPPLSTEVISTTQRQAIFEAIEAAYSNEVKAAGFKWKIRETYPMQFGAQASRMNSPSKFYVIDMYKGLRYHHRMTEDAYAMILCHEVAHHVGGAPYSSRTEWASVEGQADYFGALECMRRYLGDDHAERSIAAGLILSTILATSSGEQPPALDKRDPREVFKTVEGHTGAQCRLDTFQAGSLEYERPRCWFKP